MTRARKRQHQQVEIQLVTRNSVSGAQTTPIEFKEAESEGEPFGQNMLKIYSAEGGRSPT